MGAIGAVVVADAEFVLSSCRHDDNDDEFKLIRSREFC